MNFTLEDKVDLITYKSKRVSVGNVLSGEVGPRIQHDGTLIWDASLCPRNIGTCWMLHGHGDTPEAAVADAILRERMVQRERRIELDVIERAAGTRELSDEQLRAKAGGAA